MIQTNTQRAVEDFQAQQELFLNFIGDVGKLLKAKLLDNSQGIKITKGKRNKVIYDNAKKKNQLTAKDISTLDKLIKEKPVEKDLDSKKENNQNPNYEIKFGGETLFRQENDGTVTVNKTSQLEFIQDLDPGVTTLEDYSDAFASLEAEEAVIDADRDGIVDSEEAVIDSDRDGIVDSEETAYRTDPGSADTDGDGTIDSHEIQEKSNLVDSSISENDVLERNHDARTIESIHSQINQIKDISVKEAFSVIFDKVSDSIKSGIETTIEKLNPNSKKNQEIQAASTAVNLLENNFESTGETEYEAVDYTISQKGFDRYQVSDKEGNLKLDFQRNGTKINILESNLEGQDYRTFAKVSNILNNESSTEVDLNSKLSNLRGLAKESDRQQYLDLKGKETVENATDFLHYVGAKSWDRKDSKYSIESDGKSTLTIKAKDGRGVILSYGEQKLTQNLSQKDIHYFQELGQNTRNLAISKQQKQQHQQNLTLVKSSNLPKIKKEKELSL